MEIRKYGEIMWHWLWLLALGAVVGGVAAFVYSGLQTPVYEASTTLLISEAPQANVSDYSAILTSNLLAQTYTQMLTARPVLEQVIARLGLDTSAEALGATIRVELVNNTQLVKVYVDDSDPQQAWATANTLPVVFQDYNQALQAGRFAATEKSLADEISTVDQQITDTQAQIQALGKPATADDQAKLDRLTSDINQLRASRTGLAQSSDNLRLVEAQSLTDVAIVEKADMPQSPIRPRTLTNTALAAIAGLILALGVVFLVEYLDDTIKRPDQATALLQLPVIAVLDRLSKKDMSGGPIARVKPRSRSAEGFRSLRTNLQFAGVDRPLRSILITSPGPREGKSSVVANLAVVFAQAGQRVVVVDADLRQPTQEKLFDVSAGTGLSNLMLQEPVCLDGALRAIEAPNLSLLAPGPLPPNPADLLGSHKMKAVMELVNGLADVIILDSPPASTAADAAILAKQVDGVVLVIELGRTRVGAAVYVKNELERLGARLVGVVLNKAPSRRGGYYEYYNLPELKTA